MNMPSHSWEGMTDTTATTTRRVTAPEPPDGRGGTASPGAPPAATDTSAIAMVDALAVAWTTYRVYADPRPQDAFRRAVATLGSSSSFPWVAEVHSGGFRCHGRPVPTRRQATAALTRAAFARGIAGLGFSAPPTADDLLHLFKVIALQQEPGSEVLDPATALAAAGVGTVIVIAHGRLVEAPGELGQGDELAIAADPGESAGSHHADPARRYVDEYRLLYERLQAGDFRGLQELVHELTDSFFSLPRDQQTRLFEQFLTRHEEEPFRLLLDQFSQDDLAELATLLSPGTHPLLVEYARIAAEQEGQSREATQVLSAEEMVSDRISRMLHSGRSALRRQVGEALRAQIPGPEANFAAAIGTATAVLSLADDAGHARMARALAAKTAAAIERGDLRSAAAWGHILLSGAPSKERRETVRREVEAALRPAVLDSLLCKARRSTDLPPALGTLLILFALDPVVERLAAEEDKGRRRSLVAFLTEAARTRPGPLVRRLNDPRWFLVRNLVDILAHSGRTEAVAGLRAACRHPDSRVRREARRSLPLLDRAEAAAAAIEGLADRDPALRLQAIGLLHSAPAPEAEKGLAAFLAGRPTLEERLAVVELLAGRRTPEALALLHGLSRRRPFAGPAAREARRTARRALAETRR